VTDTESLPTKQLDGGLFVVASSSDAQLLSPQNPPLTWTIIPWLSISLRRYDFLLEDPALTFKHHSIVSKGIQRNLGASPFLKQIADRSISAAPLQRIYLTSQHS
jgi:hypothetical protein